MPPNTSRNIALFPWYKFLQHLLFWQAIWFLYLQQTIGAEEAIVLYVISDLTITLLEVPSGAMSDRLGRRMTLVLGGVCTTASMALFATGDSFAVFAAGMALFGAGMALNSGTDSALLYESLAAKGRSDEIAAHELRAWRMGFAGLAVSALAGGWMAMQAIVLPYWASAAAAGVMTLIALSFHNTGPHTRTPSALHLSTLRDALRNPLLRWLFAFSVLIYIFNELPFVFGQPYIRAAMEGIGLAGSAPLISGTVTALMMGVSLLASLGAHHLHRLAGFSSIVLLALAMQIALTGALALTGAAPAIALLLLRMVPVAISEPFVMARIQPQLRNESRATYLSVQSLCSRVLFAGSLLIASGAPGDRKLLAHEDIRLILGVYVLVGVISLALLALQARRLQPEG